MTPESKKRFIWLLVLLALGAVAVGVAAGPLMRAYRQYTARQDVTEARTLLGQKDYEGALGSARRAYVSDPQNPDVVRTVAQIYNEVDPAKAEDFWGKTFELSDDDSDLGNWVSSALKAGDYETAQTQLEEMAVRGLTDSAYHYYRGQVLLHEQDLTGALIEARKALAQEPADERAHFFFVQLTQLSNDPDLRKEGMDYLWHLARQYDRLSLRSLRNLANYTENSDTERLEIIRLINEHPMAEREDRLLALRLAYQLSDTNADANLAQAKRYFDLYNPVEMAELGRWLNQQGRYEQTLSVIPAEEAFSRKDLFLVRLDALAQLGKWTEIGQLLQRPNVPLDDFLKHLFLARVNFQTGKLAEGEIAWDRAVLEASRDEDKLWYLVQYARKLGLNGEAIKALWRLTEFPVQKRRACGQLLLLYQLEHATAGMQKVLDFMAQSYPDNLSVLNDWAYVNLLLKEKGQQSLQAALTVIRESPRPYLAHYVTLAFAYYRLGDFKQALATLQPLEVDWAETPPKWRVVYAAILRANGRFDRAQEILQGVQPADLLPQELALVRAPSADS